jgi:5-amino-6-(5-phospho-D-ribitylamino)uracil phosphatase
VLRDVTMDMETAQGIIDTAHERGWYMHAYIDDEVYVPFLFISKNSGFDFTWFVA